MARCGGVAAMQGVEAASAAPGIADVTISIPIGDELVPLPEGNRYLGFVFAREATPALVEQALREAQRCLHFVIEPATVAASA